MHCAHSRQLLSIGRRAAWAVHIQDIENYCQALWRFMQRPFRQSIHCDNCHDHFQSEEYQRARSKILDASSYLEYLDLAEVVAFSRLPLYAKRRQTPKKNQPRPMPSLVEEEGTKRTIVRKQKGG
jgi:hypothetical protein